MPKVINFDSLTSAAKQWDPVLRTLPFRTLNEAAKRMRLNIVNVESGEHIIKNKRRKAGIIAPYSSGLTLDQSKELMKFLEASLKPEIVFAYVPDNVTNYEDINIISNQGNPVDNKSKKHPLEYLILKDIVTSFSEDVAFNLFSAQRDEDVLSPATSFNGFNYKLSVLKTAKEISAENKNLVESGKFGQGTAQDPIDDYKKLVDWLRQANFFLRQGEVILYCSEHVMNNVRKSYKTRVAAHTDPTFEDTVKLLRDDANMPALKIITEPEFGTGSQLMLIKPGLLDIGTRSITDGNFVSVRNIERDPNEVQFWVQAAYDTRIIDIHPKVFMVNEEINGINDFAGDYIAPIAVTSISLNMPTMTVDVGASVALVDTISPFNATNQVVEWTSSAPTVAAVDGNGVVTGLSAGTANITAKTVDGEKTAVCAVTVTAIAVTGIELNDDAETIEIGEEIALTATITPANSTDKTVTWTTSDADVATVSTAGVVKGVAAGTATITATSSNPSKTDTFAVTVSAG